MAVSCLPLLVLGLVTGFFGCGSEPGGGGIVLRFAAEDGGEFFRPAVVLGASREAFSWDLGQREEARLWSFKADSARLDPVPAGLRITDVESPITLTRSVRLDALELHVIRVAADGLPKGRIRLCWARVGEALSSARCLDQRMLGGHGNSYSFNVAGHRLWSGQVDSLQLQLHPARSSTPGQALIQRVTAFRQEVDPERLASALGRSWKVTFDDESYNDTRTVLLAPPGLEKKQRLEVPRHAVLRLSYALQGGIFQPVTFRVTATRRPPAAPTVLFEDRIDPTVAQGWQEARIDLAELAGESVDLSLTTEASEPVDLYRGFPLWGHPEVVAPGPAEGRPNLLLISVDTLRADHLSLYGYERETSPKIDAWARSRGTTFENVVAAAPWTIPSHTSMLTGLDALHHGANHETAIPTSLVTLAEILRGSGYTTAGITGGGYVSASYGFSQGFDHYAAWKSLATAKAEPELNVDNALKWIEAHQGEPFFLFLHTYGLHTPYRARQPYLSHFRSLNDGDLPRWIGTRKRESLVSEGFRLRLDWIWLDDPAQRRQGTALAAEDLDWGRDLYDSGIGHVDRQLGRLFEGIERLRQERDTLVILTSDHGESLGENGLVGHTNLYDTNLLVPLIISRPDGRFAGQRVRDQVRSVDIVPTALTLLGMAPPGGLDGVSLVPLMEGRPADLPREAWSYAAMSNYGVSLRVDNRFKYIFNNTAWDPVSGEQELYRLIEDPAEERNLASEDPRAEELRRRVQERLAGEASGLWLHFRNDRPVPLQGHVGAPSSGWSKRWSKVKSWNGNLKWDAAWRFSFRVEPQGVLDVTLELPSEGSVTIEGAHDGGEPFSLTIDLGADQDSWQALYVGDSWKVGGKRPESESFTGVLAQWMGRSSAAEDSEETDPELLKQLRALGYVD